MTWVCCGSGKPDQVLDRTDLELAPTPFPGATLVKNGYVRVKLSGAVSGPALRCGCRHQARLKEQQQPNGLDVSDSCDKDVGCFSYIICGDSDF